MAQERPIIFIIDDDTSVRRALGRVMASAGLESRSFDSVEGFLEKSDLLSRGCIVADITMIGMSGLDLKRVLNIAHSPLPVILLTAHDTEQMRIAAQEAGAASFFRKPVDTQALLDAVQWALSEQPRR